MAYLTFLLPCAQAVAVYAALARHADSLVADGDGRGRGQVMADTLVERATGQATAAAVPVEVELLIDASTLVGFDDQPAELIGYGPLPAGTARDLARGPADGGVQRSVRRVHTSTDGTRLIAMETRARHFTTGQHRLLRLRDQNCRTPYCDAPIRHADHVVDWANGGPTSVANGQGDCQACNHTVQAPGWTKQANPDGSVDTTTPTGHRYRSRAPNPPDAAPPSHVERQLKRLVDAA